MAYIRLNLKLFNFLSNFIRPLTKMSTLPILHVRKNWRGTIQKLMAFISIHYILADP